MSGVLFRKLWSKLLDAAVLGAIAESYRKPEIERATVTADSIRDWFGEVDSGEISDRQEVPPRVRVETRRSAQSVLFDTCDHGLRDTVLHRNLIAT